MNANELADELENKPLAYGNDIQEWLGEAATMLRQQAQEISTLSDRIAELEKAIKDADEASNSAEGVGLVYWFQLLMEEESTSCKLIKDLLK